MKVLYAYLLLVVLLGLGACASQTPVAQPYPVTYQKKMQAAQHWDMVAADVASRLRSAIASTDSAGRTVVLSVQKPKTNTAFNQAFHDLLITRLIEQGFSVSSSPSAGLPVTYEVQVIPNYDTPDTEVLITTSLMSGDRYLARINDIYYISNDNSDQYRYLARATGPATRRMEVVGQ